MAKLTPMMTQYLEMKEQYSDCLLFFRLGDFYEMFFDDAILASKELEIALTGRDCGMEKRAPMCGVPHHSANIYINKLIHKGYKVAICEQVEDPSEAVGLVRRDVVRVITPGTVTDDNILSEGQNNFIACAFLQGKEVAISYCDVSTGQFYVVCVEAGREYLGFLRELIRISPKQLLLCSQLMELKYKIENTFKEYAILIEPLEDYRFDENHSQDLLKAHFKVENLNGLGIGHSKSMIGACGALLDYLLQTQKNDLAHITQIVIITDRSFMTLDSTTKRNLELTQTIREGSKRGSLLWLLDKTKTSMGARQIRSYIEQPLLSKQKIVNRQGAVCEIFDDMILREEIREALEGIYDLERLTSKISYSTLDAKNCISLKNSFERLPVLKNALSGCKSPLLSQLYKRLDDMSDIKDLLGRAIADEPAQGIKDGGIIKKGFHSEIDALRDIAENGEKYILELEQKERQSTGIKNLKIGFNKVFGYFIEVTKSYLDLVPYGYIRKQTLAGCERFITQELKDMEEKILTAKEKCVKLEYAVFIEVRKKMAENIKRLLQTAQIIAQIDALQSLAQAAFEYDFVCPVVIDEPAIRIIEGRHPVVQRASKEEFVPNDAVLDNENNNLIVITGPNMGGKSTYMRQIALIVLMAHIGSFVPAAKAEICLIDRIFTRVGASDDLSSGQSTFMVEMNELANILHNATDKSLIILDEIGRGTSTIDGLSIAVATAKYIAGKIKAKTLFATHYHELTALEKTVPGISNYYVAVKELSGNVLFLHKILKGSTNKSFGIEVAKLAGLPEELVEDSKEVLHTLESSEESAPIGGFEKALSPTQTEGKRQPAATSERAQLPENEKKALEVIKKADINTLAPIEALNLLNQCKQLLTD